MVFITITKLIQCNDNAKRLRRFCPTGGRNRPIDTKVIKKAQLVKPQLAARPLAFWQTGFS